jgi:hypothetical protein
MIEIKLRILNTPNVKLFNNSPLWKNRHYPYYCLFLFLSNTQNPINYKLIHESIKNNKSEFYYPDLMDKFQMVIQLSLQIKRHLVTDILFKIISRILGLTDYWTVFLNMKI